MYFLGSTSCIGVIIVAAHVVFVDPYVYGCDADWGVPCVSCFGLNQILF